MTRARKPPPPPGHRYLKKGERVQLGDVYANKSSSPSWQEVDYMLAFRTYSGRNSIRWYARKKKGRKS